MRESRRNCVLHTVLLLVAALASAWPASAQRNPGAMLRQAATEELTPKSLAAPHVAESLVAPAASLPAATEGARDQLAALRAWNDGRRQPVRNGFVRPLPGALVASLADTGETKSGTAVRLPAGNLVWATHIRVTGAYRVRLHLQDVRVPVGTTFWVYGAGETPRRFGAELSGSDGLWSPSVGGEEVFLEVAAPAGAATVRGQGFRVVEVAEILPGTDVPPALGGATSPKATSCLVDATCISSSTFSPISELRSAVGRLEFIDAGSAYICSGGLLNDTDPATVIPYLLTANHCISTQAAASSLEVFWDYATASCNGLAPNLSTLPRSIGSTLLATGVAGAASDYTLLRLTSVPGVRWYLGWNANASAVSSGTVLHRLSYPLGGPQSFTSYIVDTASQTCTGISRPTFLYTTVTQGATLGGSSGSPVVLEDGTVVGQLLGACGTDPSNGCDSINNNDVDGAFAASFPALAQYLQPQGSTDPCVEGPDVACLQGGRFEVRVQWQTASSSGVGQVQSFNGQRAETTETVDWWFFSSSNFEMGLKVLDGCTINNHFWVYGSGLTDQGWTVTVRDTTNGAIRSYSNSLGHLSTTFADTSAFACH